MRTPKPKGLRIDTDPNALRIMINSKAPPRPPRRRLNNQRIWDRMPIEILVQIAKSLTPYELVKLAVTCRSANRAVKSINPLLLARRQHFSFLFQHLSDTAHKHDGRAAFITDAEELFDEMAVSLRSCYGEATSHRNGFYSDFECDFVLSALSRNDHITRNMFISDMLAVYGQLRRGLFWEEESEGPPTTAEEEFFRGDQPRHGRWFKISTEVVPEKKPSIVARLKRKLGIPSNQVKCMSPTQFKSAPSSPRPSSRKSSSSSSPSARIEFDENDVKAIILRWARDKSTDVHMMSFVKIYGNGWGFEWLLGSRLNDF